MQKIDVKFKDRAEVVKFLLEAEEAGLSYRIEVSLVEELEQKFKLLEAGGVKIKPEVTPRPLNKPKRGRGRPPKIKDKFQVDIT